MYLCTFAMLLRTSKHPNHTQVQALDTFEGFKTASKRPESCPNHVQVGVCGACCSTTVPAVTSETQVAGTMCLWVFGSSVAGPFLGSGRPKRWRCCENDRKSSKVMNCLRFSPFGTKGLAWPGLAWPGLAWPGLAWPDPRWPRFGAERSKSQTVHHF